MSYNPNDWALNLNDDTFNALKTDFNVVLKKTLHNMEQKESEAAELTVKLKISLERTKQASGDDIPRDVIIPKFDHKVSSVMQYKDEKTGTLGGNYELVWDKERGEWVMREIIDGQQNIFDAEYMVVDCDDNGDDAEHTSGVYSTPALPGGEPLALPGKFPDDDENGADNDYPYEEPTGEDGDE